MSVATSSGFVVTEGVPIRFLALQWSEGWEFDHPTVLLEPVVRYSPFGVMCERMIEEVAVDIAIDADDDPTTVIRDALDNDGVRQEFEWRGWSIANLRRVAKKALAGKRFPQKHYHAEEQWLVFFRTPQDGLMFRDATPEEVESHPHRSSTGS
ncbi:hypothetical protein ACYOEI_31730 [Singulisphaera rosea]